MGEPDVVEDLRAEVEAGHMSVRGVARAIVGESADNRRLESKRRHLTKLLDGDNRPTPDTIREIAEALGREPKPYLEARASARRLTPREQLADAIRRLDALEATVRPTATGAALDVPKLRRLLKDIEATVESLQRTAGDLTERVASLEQPDGAARPRSSAAGTPRRGRRK